MEGPSWLNAALTLGGVLGTAITAVATIFLWLVTRTLAKETKRMAEASAQPHVVATIEPNRWSMIHADIRVENTGNATAYDIQVSFDPPLVNGPVREDEVVPFNRISVLRPGQALSSYVSEWNALAEHTYTVVVSWRRNAQKNERESNTYTLRMSDMKGITRLGASDPLIQLAEEVKKMREDWKSVANGSKKISTNVFTSSDRLNGTRNSRIQHDETADSKAPNETPP